MSEDTKEVIRAKKLRVRQDLLTVLEGLSEADWAKSVFAEDTRWTISDLVRHLLNAEKGMTGLITQWRVGKNPVPADFDRDRFNQSVVRKAKGKSPETLMAEMAGNHANFLQVLASIEEEDWEKNGRHASLRIMTIEEICHLIPDHESDHIQHIQTALNS